MPATPSDRAFAEAQGIVTSASFTPESRRRLSGPGLRTFLNIAESWQLSEPQRRAVLGAPPRSTYYNWIAKAQAGQRVSLPLDSLLRISAILGIHKDLRILFGSPDRGLRWLRNENSAPLFGGQRPLDLVLSGTQVGIVEVRRFLDAWRGGLSAAPLDHEIEDATWSDRDIRIQDA